MIKYLIDSSHKLCVDEGFSLDSSKNTSILGNEYLTFIRAGMLAYALLLIAAQGGRIKKIEKKVITFNKHRVKKYIRDKVDRVFLSVAIASESKTFVSNDFIDFNYNKRGFLGKQFGVNVRCSDDICC